MTDFNLSEDDAYRFGEYGITRGGYRPVVILPESHARRLVELKNYAEIFGIVLFVISAALFFINTISSVIPRAIGALVIGFRAVIIILSHIVIAKTVVREIQESEGGVQMKSSTSGSLRTQTINTRAQVMNSELHIQFRYYRRRLTELKLEIESRSGSIASNEIERRVTLPPASIGDEHESEVIIDLTAPTVGQDQSDTLIVRLDLVDPFTGEEDKFRRVGELTIPVSFSGTDQMSSEIIKKEYEIEVLDS